MFTAAVPILLFIVAAAVAAVGMLAMGTLLGPKRKTRVKEMPYESGMDPFHDTRRRFPIQFYLVAISFLVFDVELLFVYPWAVASRNPAGVDAAVEAGLVSSRGLVFGGVMFFVVLLVAGFVYDWRKGVFKWR